MKRPRFQSQPTWAQFAALFAMMFIVLVMGFFAMRDMNAHLHEVQESQGEAAQRGYAQAAHICMSEIISAVTTTDVTPEQVRENIGGFCSAEPRLAYYLPVICEQVFPDVPTCGSKVDEPVL